MSDGQSEDIQLSLGFDTDKIAAGGDLYVKKLEEIQDATKRTAAQTVESNRIMGMSNDQLVEKGRQAIIRGEQEAKAAADRARQIAAQAAAQAAEDARRASGEAARAYLDTMKAAFLSQQAAIKEQVTKGLLNEKGAKEAARQNALAYKQELLAGSRGSMFTGVTDAAASAKLMGSVTTEVAAAEKAATAAQGVGLAAKVGSMGLGRLRYSMISLMDSMVGIPPVAGRVGGALASLAVPLAPLIAIIAGIAALAGAYHYLMKPQNDLSDAQEKYNEVTVRSAQYTREFGAALGSLNQLGNAGEASKQIAEVRKEAEKINGDLTSNLQAFTQGLRYMLRDAVTQDGSSRFYMQVSGMNEQFKAGTLNLKQYKDELIAMGKANPAIQDLVNRQLGLVAASGALKDKMDELTAAQNLTAVGAQDMLEKYGVRNPAMGKALENLDKLRQRVVAARTGGRDAETRVRGQQDALDKARSMWTDYATNTAEGRSATNMGRVSFDAAYNGGPSAAHDAAAAMVQVTKDEAKATADATKAIEDYNKAEAERKRIKEELYRLNKNEADAVTERKQALADQERLSEAANKGAEAYAKVNTQLAEEAKIRAALKQIRDQATDSQTHKLLISPAELARRQKEASDGIRAQDTAQDTNKNRLTVAELRQETEALERSAVAHAQGKQATAEENIELRYQADLRKANAMGATAEADSMRQAAQYRKEAAQRDQAAQKEGTDREAKEKAAIARVEQERLKVFTNTQQAMSSVFDQFLTGAIGRGRKAWQTLWDDMKSTFDKALAGILSNFAAKKIASSLAGVFAIGASASAQGTVRGPDGGTMTMGLDNSVFSPGMLAKANTPAPSALQQVGSGAMAGVGGAVAGYAAGNMLYSTSHGTFGNMARGAIGGAAAGAATGFAVGGPVGAAIGAVTGFVAGIVGAGSAAKEAKKQMDELRKSLANSILSIKATISNNGLDLAVSQVKQQFDDLRKQTEAAYSGGGKNSKMVADRNAQLAQLNSLEAQRIAQLQAEDALQRKNFAEDLQVRLLDAQGKQIDADALRLKLAQEREYNDAVKNNADAATLALLKQVQAQEAVKAATQETTSALLNVPTGFKVARATFEAMPLGSPNRPGGVDLFSPTSGGAMAIPNAPQTVILQVGGKEIARAVLKEFQAQSARGGNPQDWADVQQIQ